MSAGKGGFPSRRPHFRSHPKLDLDRRAKNGLNHLSNHHDCLRPQIGSSVKTPHNIAAIRRTTAALSAFLLAGTAHGDSFIYTNDFEGAIGGEWSHTQTSVTPLGSRRFLGDFLNDQVQLSLAGLSPHGSVTVAFQLFILNSWDGNSPSAGDPLPDVWDLSIVGGPTLLHTTFAIVDTNPAASAARQAYPDSHPGGSHLPETGAAEVDTLGYLFFGSQTDAVYDLTFTFPHADPALLLQFSGIGLERLNDESWGIDNVSVSLAGVPEPTVAVSLLIGFGLLAGRRCTLTKMKAMS